MPQLETNRLTLRPLNLSDAARIEQLAGDYDVAKTTLNIPHPYPSGAAEPFINSMLEAEKDGRVVIFAICEKSSEDLIGIMNISISAMHNRGELAYWIGKPYWGKGYGTEAAQVLLSYGFEQLELHKIFAEAYTSNPGSWRIMEKIGLVYEGTLRQHVYRFGQYHDLAFYGMLRDEYRQRTS